MKKYIIFCLLFTGIFMLSAVKVYTAEPVHINDEGDYEADIDKFIPQSRVYVKNSMLADKLENAAQKQLNKNKKNESKSKIQNKIPLGNKNSTNFKKSYKWF